MSNDEAGNENAEPVKTRDRSGPITVLAIFLVGGLVLVSMLFLFQGFAPLDVEWENYGWTWNPSREE